MNELTLDGKIVEIQMRVVSPTLLEKLKVEQFISESTHILNALRFRVNK